MTRFLLVNRIALDFFHGPQWFFAYSHILRVLYSLNNGNKLMPENIKIQWLFDRYLCSVWVDNINQGLWGYKYSADLDFHSRMETNINFGTIPPNCQLVQISKKHRPFLRFNCIHGVTLDKSFYIEVYLSLYHVCINSNPLYISREQLLQRINLSVPS